MDVAEGCTRELSWTGRKRSQCLQPLPQLSVEMEKSTGGQKLVVGPVQKPFIGCLPKSPHPTANRGDKPYFTTRHHDESPRCGMLIRALHVEATVNQ